jgi:hypothetical protein
MKLKIWANCNRNSLEKGYIKLMEDNQPRTPGRKTKEKGHFTV